MSSDETSLIVRAATATTYEALKRSRADSGVGPSVPSASGLMTKDRAVARRILGAVSLAALLDALEQPALFERLQVIVEPLARYAKGARETGGGVGSGQSGEQCSSSASQGSRRGFGLLDDFNAGGLAHHVGMIDTDNIICQDILNMSEPSSISILPITRS